MASSTVPPAMWGLSTAGTVELAIVLYLLQGLIAPVTNPLIDQWLLGQTPRERMSAVSSWRQVAADASAMVGASVGGRLRGGGECPGRAATGPRGPLAVRPAGRPRGATPPRPEPRRARVTRQPRRTARPVGRDGGAAPTLVWYRRRGGAAAAALPLPPAPGSADRQCRVPGAPPGAARGMRTGLLSRGEPIR